MSEVKLFRKNSFGIGTWRVYSLPPVSRTRGIVVIAHTSSEGGSEVTHHDEVITNQSGRTIEQQMELEIESRVRRQLDKGYKRTREEALLGATNQLGLINPMLAQKITDVRLTQADFEYAYVQPKLDGHRCLITKQGGEMAAYSRKGKPIETVGHLLEDMSNWMQDGDTLDGELYIHGMALQSISSLIKREQPESRKLCYHWYDMCLAASYRNRWRTITDLYANCKNPQIQLVPTNRVQKMSEVYTLFREYRSMKYEGAMLRLSRFGYEDGKRSNQLLKVKERHDCEVTVLSCVPSARGWAVLTVQTDWGKTFDVSAPGSEVEKREVLENFETKYKGKRLTVEYANLTEDQIPFHCVAMRWHEEV